MAGAGSLYRRRLCLFAAICLLATGCADLDFLPTWVPFMGPISDDLPGVTPPWQRMEQYRELSEKAARSSPEERTRVSQQLAETIKTEKDPLVRLEIIRTLGHYPSAAADAVLEAAMSDDESRIRVAACEAWGKRRDAKTIELLSNAFRSDVDIDVRLAAAKSLGETKNQAVVAVLGEGLTDRNPAVQVRVMLALKEATGKDFDNNVERWQQYVKGQPVAEPSWAQRIMPWWK